MIYGVYLHVLCRVRGRVTPTDEINDFQMKM